MTENFHVDCKLSIHLLQFNYQFMCHYYFLFNILNFDIIKIIFDELIKFENFFRKI